MTRESESFRHGQSLLRYFRPSSSVLLEQERGQQNDRVVAERSHPSLPRFRSRRNEPPDNDSKAQLLRSNKGSGVRVALARGRVRRARGSIAAARVGLLAEYLPRWDWPVRSPPPPGIQKCPD